MANRKMPKVVCVRHGGKVPKDKCIETPNGWVCKRCLAEEGFNEVVHKTADMLYKTVPQQQKMCTRCGKRPTTTSWCRECHREYSRKRRRKEGYNEYHAAYVKQWREERKH